MSNRYNKQSEKRKVSQINIEPLRGAHPEVLYQQSDHLAVVNALIDILVQVIGDITASVCPLFEDYN